MSIQEYSQAVVSKASYTDREDGGGAGGGGRSSTLRTLGSLEPQRRLLFSSHQPKAMYLL